MELTNIKLGTQEVELTDGTKVQMEVKMPVRTNEFVTAVAMAHPTWTFTPNYVCRQYEHIERNGRIYSQIKGLQVHEVTVYQNKTELGRIGADTHGAHKYTIFNERISAKRERGSHARTGDLKKALGMVEKMFYPKKDKEILKEIVSRARDTISSHTRQRRYNLDDLWRNMSKVAVHFIADNLETFRQYAGASAIKGLDTYTEALDIRDKAQALEDNYNKNEASIVTIMNDVFYFSFASKDPIAFKRDDVAPQIKASIGMLKLIERGKSIDDVGLRCEEDVFLVNVPNIVSQGEPYAIS